MRVGVISDMHAPRHPKRRPPRGGRGVRLRRLFPDDGTLMQVRIVAVT